MITTIATAMSHTAVDDHLRVASLLLQQQQQNSGRNSTAVHQFDSIETENHSNGNGNSTPAVSTSVAGSLGQLCNNSNNNNNDSKPQASVHQASCQAQQHQQEQQQQQQMQHQHPQHQQQDQQEQQPLQRQYPANHPLGNSKHLCSICGDRATGKHYGVYSCEGCKGFFKRTIRKDIVYVCRSQGSCLIDMRQRNRCQYCRYQKCLSRGMKREAVQEEKQRLKLRATAASLAIANAGITSLTGVTGTLPLSHQYLNQQQQQQHQVADLNTNTSNRDNNNNSNSNSNNNSSHSNGLADKQQAITSNNGVNGTSASNNQCDTSDNQFGRVESTTAQQQIMFGPGAGYPYAPAYLHHQHQHHSQHNQSHQTGAGSGGRPSSSNNSDRQVLSPASSSTPTGYQSSLAPVTPTATPIDPYQFSPQSHQHQHQQVHSNQHNQHIQLGQHQQHQHQQRQQHHRSSFSATSGNQFASSGGGGTHRSSISSASDITCSIKRTGQQQYLGERIVDELTLKWAAQVQIERLLDWAKSVPKFTELLIDDQVTLLKASWNELIIADIAFRSVESIRDGSMPSLGPAQASPSPPLAAAAAAANNNNRHQSDAVMINSLCIGRGLFINESQADDVGLGNMFERIINELVWKMYDMRVDANELACLRAIILFNPETHGLKTSQPIEEYRGNIYTTLEAYCRHNYEHQPNRFGKLLLRLPVLRSIGLKCNSIRRCDIMSTSLAATTTTTPTTTMTMTTTTNMMTTTSREFNYNHQHHQYGSLQNFNNNNSSSFVNGGNCGVDSSSVGVASPASSGSSSVNSNCSNSISSTSAGLLVGPINSAPTMAATNTTTALGATHKLGYQVKLLFFDLCYESSAVDLFLRSSLSMH